MECEDGVMPVGMLIGMWWTADEDGYEDAMPVRMMSPDTLDGWMDGNQSGSRLTRWQLSLLGLTSYSLACARVPWFLPSVAKISPSPSLVFVLEVLSFVSPCVCSDTDCALLQVAINQDSFSFVLL
jgi:hypothetical protein